MRQLHMRQRLLLPLRRIGREQVVQRRLPLRMLDVDDRLRRAAREYVAAELWQAHELLRHGAKSLEPLQAQGERVRHVLRRRPFGFFGFGQQQPRFEVGEPRRHDEIVGGKLEAELPRLLDEGEILVGERQDGDLCEIHLLVPRQRQQQIEWALKAFDVDNQRRLVFGALGDDVGGERRLRDHHDTTTLASSRAKSCAKRARAAARSISSGWRRAASAASVRRAAAPPRIGDSCATACISSSRPLQWSARSQPAAMAARVRSPIVPLSAPIEMSSLINAPENPIDLRITSPIIVGDAVAGAVGSSAVNTTWAVIPSGRWPSGRKAAKSVASSVAPSVVTTGSFSWLSAMARPCPGMCLRTGSTPPAMSPSATAAASTETCSGVVP